MFVTSLTPKPLTSVSVLMARSSFCHRACSSVKPPSAMLNMNLTLVSRCCAFVISLPFGAGAGVGVGVAVGAGVALEVDASSGFVSGADSK